MLLSATASRSILTNCYIYDCTRAGPSPTPALDHTSILLPPSHVSSPPDHTSILPPSHIFVAPPTVAIPPSIESSHKWHSPFWVPAVGVVFAVSVLMAFFAAYYHTVPAAQDLHDVLVSSIIAVAEVQDETDAVRMIEDLNLESLHKAHVSLVLLNGVMMGSIEDPQKAARILHSLSRLDEAYKDGVFQTFRWFFEKLNDGVFPAEDETIKHAIQQVASYFATLVKEGLLRPGVSIRNLRVSAQTMAIPSYYTFVLYFFEEFEDIAPFAGRNKMYIKDLFDGENQEDVEAWRKFERDITASIQFWRVLLSSRLERMAA